MVRKGNRYKIPIEDNRTNSTLGYYENFEVDFSDLEKIFNNLENEIKDKNKVRTKKHMNKILKRLREIWYKHPELRLGQLINSVKNSFYLEDEDLLVAIENLLDVNKNER